MMPTYSNLAPSAVEERAAILRWLRSCPIERKLVGRLADDIERGEHTIDTAGVLAAIREAFPDVDVKPEDARPPSELEVMTHLLGALEKYTTTQDRMSVAFEKIAEGIVRATRTYARRTRPVKRRAKS